MKQLTRLQGTTAIFLVIGTAVQADVTASDVWANITNFYDVAGYNMTPGSVNDTGDKVSVTDLVMSFPNPYADLQTEIAIDMSATLPSMELTSNSDGTVTVTVSESYPMNMVITPAGEDPGNFGVIISQPGLSIVASGDPDNVSYAIEGPSVTLTLDKIEIPGEDDIGDAIQASIEMGAYSGSYSVGSGSSPALNMKLGAAGANMTITAREPGGSGAFDASLDFAGFDWSASGTYAQGDKPGDMTSMLKAGMTSKGEITHGGSTYAMSFQDRNDSFMLEGSSSSGRVDFDMSASGLSYNIGNTDMAIKVAGSEIPLPEVTMGAAATLFGITMPVVASDSPEDMGLRMRFEGLTISDMIWGMLDAGGQLPRDPMTLIVDLGGKANWFIDIMDPKAMMEADVELPGALHALDINEVKLSAVGAEVNGSGAFTFDMNNFSPAFGGLPAPTGSLDVSVNGANGLMDKLVGMGLVGQEEVMGARMMLGLFARPGDGPDSLVSKIEVDGATGAVSANGQRLQ